MGAAAKREAEMWGMDSAAPYFAEANIGCRDKSEDGEVDFDEARPVLLAQSDAFLCERDTIDQVLRGVGGEGEREGEGEGEGGASPR